jgi:hypothetical protein
MRALPLVIVAALASASCNAVNRFSCETDEQCNVQAGGRCHATDVCTYPSANCPSGYAFDDGVCVLDSVADASIEAPDAATPTIDGNWPDAQSPSARWVFLSGNARSDRTIPDSPQPMEPIMLYVPDGAGGYRNVWTSTEKDWTRAIAWADYDKDGRLDFAVGNGFGNTRRNRIYHNEGNDTFSVAWTAPTATFTQAVAWSDVDRDGDLDLLAGTSTSVKVYRQGAATFTEAELVGSISMVGSLAMADMDGDGDDDLALGAGSSARIYANNGSGIFNSRWSVETSTGSNALAWGDYDKDGDLDLAVEVQQRLTVYQQTGGSFVRAFDSGIDHQPALDRMGIEGLAWLDFDGDGDLDIATAGLLVPVGGGELVADKQRVFRNAGGSFTVAWESSTALQAYSMSVGDFNNDGKPDLVYGIDGPDMVFENTGGSFSSVWGSGTTDITHAIAWAPFESQ